MAATSRMTREITGGHHTTIVALMQRQFALIRAGERQVVGPERPGAAADRPPFATRTGEDGRDGRGHAEDSCGKRDRGIIGSRALPRRLHHPAADAAGWPERARSRADTPVLGSRRAVVLTRRGFRCPWAICWGRWIVC